MTGIMPKRQILRVLPPSVYHLKAKTLQHASAMQLIVMKFLQDALNAVHKNVALSVGGRRKQTIINHNRSKNISTSSLVVGDFVPVCHATDRGHNLRFKWHSPRHITAEHRPLVYSVTPLSGAKNERAHCALLLK